MQPNHIEIFNRINHTEITDCIQPKIGQLQLIFIVAILLLIGWFYSLYSYNKAELEEVRWCLDWNERTANEWHYDANIGCALNDN